MIQKGKIGKRKYKIKFEYVNDYIKYKQIKYIGKRQRLVELNLKICFI